MRFSNRIEAGRLLAKKLAAYTNRPDVIVLGLPRGGVPVAYEVARALNAPLDVFLVRKLGMPGHEEYAMGAIASGNVRVLNTSLVDSLRIPDELIERVTEREKRELERREKLYRDSFEPVPVRGRTVIIVDDGLATGSTMRAAVDALKDQGPKSIIVAAPVAAQDTCESFNDMVDSTCICVTTPMPFYGVSCWYQNFSQTTDGEVCYLLRHAREILRKRVEESSMKTKEIPKEEWGTFFDNFSRRYEGWLVTLEILDAEIGAQVEGRELAFEGIVNEWDEIKGNEITIMVGGKPDNHITHSIHSALEVSLEQTDEEADAALAIKSVDGTTTLLRFRSPMLPELADGMVPQLSTRPVAEKRS